MTLFDSLLKKHNMYAKANVKDADMVPFLAVLGYHINECGVEFLYQPISLWVIPRCVHLFHTKFFKSESVLTDNSLLDQKAIHQGYHDGR